jgi:type II secretory ATPase GspE/PulE/Tfp pilus assembly ATPase PilB-like protein
MCTLRQDGWRKVLAGRTTVDEVARVTKGEDLVTKR